MSIDEKAGNQMQNSKGNQKMRKNLNISDFI